MKWLKKIVGDFTGAAQDNKPPAPATPPAAPATPVAAAQPPVPAAQPAPRSLQVSVQEFEKAREDFFAALKSDDSATVNRIAADYPDEALDWRTAEGTPLGIAQKSNSLECFKTLIALGADKEQDYQGGSFPLHYAQTNNQKAFFDYLLESGANIERTFTTATFQNMVSEKMTYTALATAIKQGNKEAAIALMEHGASVLAPYTYERENLTLMIHGGSSPTPKPKTAVDYAMERGQFLIADIAKRAHILRSDYLARPAAPAPAALEPAETATDIGVMQPLRLKKQPDLKS